MKPPNLLVIMSDEHQARAMGCAGHPFVRTPHLDALAARGTRFTDAYTPSPICVPARASFATGLYAHQLRLWDNAMPYDGSVPSWGHVLQEKDVAVESIGKLHYRDTKDSNGFDVEHIPMMVADGVGMVWASIRKEDERVFGKGRMLGSYIGPGDSSYTRYDEAVVTRTVNWLAARAACDDKKPWCLYVGLVAPHFPLVVPKEFYDLYPLEMMPAPKLLPKDGYVRHPWAEKQNAYMDNDSKFESDEERVRAIASYYGLCSWLDHNVGRIIAALAAAGLSDETTIIYTSDHGDNLGARGLWGKSNLYQESVAIPMIAAGPRIPQGVCNTPVNLVDLSVTIASHFGGTLEGAPGARSLMEIAAAPDELERPAFSEYHAAGAVSGAFMIKKGRWKYNFYVGFPAELFDLEADPEELTNLAAEPGHAETLARMHTELLKVCDPLAADAQAFQDQAEMIARYGGREAALKMGAPAATPPPAI